MSLITQSGLKMRAAVTLGVACGLAVSVSACGSSSSSPASTTTSASSSAGTPAKTSVPPYTGPEKSLPTSYGTPKVKAGAHLVLGYLNPQQGVLGLDEEQAGAQAEWKALGGTSIAYSINVNTQTQVAKFNDLLAQGVNAIVLQPQDPTALAPELAKARAKGIVLIAASTPGNAAQPNLPGYATDTMQSDDQCAYDNVKAVAAAKPDGTYVLLPSALPYPSIQYFPTREEFWAKKFGLKMLGSVSSGTGFLPANGATAMDAIEARYPSTDAVLAWTDLVAQGAATTVRATHKNIIVTGANGGGAASALAKSSSSFYTCSYQFPTIGKQEAIAAYDELTKQHLPLPAKVAITPVEVSKSAG